MSNQSQLEAPPSPAQTPVELSDELLQETPDQDTTSSEPDKKPVTYRQLLSNPNFRLLWLGQGITTFGSFFTRVAVPIYVYTLTDSYSQLGFAFFVHYLPALVFGLLAGALVDRWNRRRTMIYTDLLSCVLLCCLVAVIVLPAPNVIKLGAIYSITFLSSILRELFTSARIAIFTEVVKENELLPANSLDQSTQTLGELLSYPLAAYALLSIGPEIVFGIDALSFLISAGLIWAVKTRPAAAETSEARSLWDDMMAGLTMVQSVPLLRKITILSLIVPLAFMLYATLQLPFAVEKLGSTAEIGFPALEGSLAGGATLGLLAVGRWGQHMARWKLVAVGILGFGASLSLVGLVPQFDAFVTLPPLGGATGWTPLLVIAMVLTLVVGVTNGLIASSLRTVQQESVPREMIGRVASVVSVASGLGWSIGALLTGLGEGRADLVISTIGAILLIIGVFSMWWLRPSADENQADQNQPVPQQSLSQ